MIVNASPAFVHWLPYAPTMLWNTAQKHRNMIFMGISQSEITSSFTYVSKAVKLPLSPAHQLFMELLPHPVSDYTAVLQAQHLHLPRKKAGPKLLCTVSLALPHLNLNWIQSWHNLGTARAIAMLYPCLCQGSFLFRWYPLLTDNDKLIL